MTDTQKLINELSQFNGTENWYKNPLFPGYYYTDGIQYLAEQAGAYWLIDYIFSNQSISAIRKLTFQAWKLDVNDDHTAKISVMDDNGAEVYSFHLEFTDFPLKEISLWLTDRILLLPSEY